MNIKEMEMNNMNQDILRFSYSGFQHSVLYSKYKLHSNARNQPIFKFKNFVVSPGSRSIHVDGNRVSLGSRAFDLLVILLSSPGSIVSKDEIFDYVWPSTVVEESNLRVQMNQVRKLLGHFGEVIVNVPGRGYLFVAEVTTEWPDKEAC